MAHLEAKAAREVFRKQDRIKAKAESKPKCSYIPSQEPRAQGTNNAQSMARFEGLFPPDALPRDPVQATGPTSKSRHTHTQLNQN